MEKSEPRTVPELLEAWCSRQPDKQFLAVEDLDGRIEELTYGEFQDRVLKLAALLQRHGIRKGDKVLLH